MSDRCLDDSCPRRSRWAVGFDTPRGTVYVGGFCSVHAGKWVEDTTARPYLIPEEGRLVVIEEEWLRATEQRARRDKDSGG